MHCHAEMALAFVLLSLRGAAEAAEVVVELAWPSLGASTLTITEALTRGNDKNKNLLLNNAVFVAPGRELFLSFPVGIFYYILQ